MLCVVASEKYPWEGFHTFLFRNDFSRPPMIQMWQRLYGFHGSRISKTFSLPQTSLVRLDLHYGNGPLLSILVVPILGAPFSTA